jgi:hypothetical protein
MSWQLTVPTAGGIRRLGRKYLEEFWRTWSFLSERLEQLREGEA